MSNPSVSIILPVYNAADSLECTLASIRDQSVSSYQLIAIDDGSTDDSLAVLLRAEAKDRRVQVVSKANGGVSLARNFGVELAKAPYLAFIDADDIWHSEKLSAHLCHHAANPHIEASFARIGFLPQRASELADCKTQSTVPLYALSMTDVLGENPVCTSSNFFIRRETFERFGGFDKQLTHAEDQEFLARLVANDVQILGLDRLLTAYRFSDDGLSMNLTAMYESWRSFAVNYLDDQQFDAMDALYLRYLARRTLRSAGPGKQSLNYAMAGLKADHNTFLADRYRGVATLAASLIATVTPPQLRRHLFS